MKQFALEFNSKPNDDGLQGDIPTTYDGDEKRANREYWEKQLFTISIDYSGSTDGRYDSNQVLGLKRDAVKGFLRNELEEVYNRYPGDKSDVFGNFKRTNRLSGDISDLEKAGSEIGDKVTYMDNRSLLSCYSVLLDETRFENKHGYNFPSRGIKARYSDVFHRLSGDGAEQGEPITEQTGFL